MKALAGGLLLSLIGTTALVGQERDRSFERITLALQQPSPIIRAEAPFETPSPRKLGIFTLMPPVSPGEMIRVSIPIGELVTRAFKGIAASNRRRQEIAVRRKVAAELEQFAKP